MDNGVNTFQLPRLSRFDCSIHPSSCAAKYATPATDVRENVLRMEMPAVGMSVYPSSTIFHIDMYFPPTSRPFSCRNMFFQLNPSSSKAFMCHLKWTSMNQTVCQSGHIQFRGTYRGTESKSQGSFLSRSIINTSDIFNEDIGIFWSYIVVSMITRFLELLNQPREKPIILSIHMYPPLFSFASSLAIIIKTSNHLPMIFDQLFQIPVHHLGQATWAIAEISFQWASAESEHLHAVTSSMKRGGPSLWFGPWWWENDGKC